MVDLSLDYQSPSLFQFFLNIRVGVLHVFSFELSHTGQKPSIGVQRNQRITYN